MTNQQQTDLKTWLDNPSQELPKSLKTVLIEKILKDWKMREHSTPILDQEDWEIWENHSDQTKILSIQAFLSRTPEGEAVMPFLDVETVEWKKLQSDLKKLRFNSYYKTTNQFIREEKEAHICQTLDHLLFNSFVEVLRTGKTFDEALEIITKIYLININ